MIIESHFGNFDSLYRNTDEASLAKLASLVQKTLKLQLFPVLCLFIALKDHSFLDGFFKKKNTSYKIAMSQVGGRRASSEVYLLVNLLKNRP